MIIQDLPVPNVLNIDCMDLEDLEKYISKVDPWALAAKRFRSYLAQAIAARRARACGQIETALYWERKADRTYRHLPLTWRW